MSTEKSNVSALNMAIEYVRQAQSLLMPMLIQQPYKNNAVFSKISQDDVNPSYGFDEASNHELFRILQAKDFPCLVYSEEEHAWKQVGSNPKYRVVCDPFCNSFLASHTFREAAIAICISNLDGDFIACAIGDLQIKRIYYADQSSAYVLEEFVQENNKSTKIHVSGVVSIEDAFIVTPLLKPERRKKVGKLDFFQKAKVIHGVDGAIMIARLAGGDIDAYLDPLKGQPLYEVPCCELILKAGGVVTDDTGHPFELKEIISSLANEEKKRYKIVAASNKTLHRSLLAEINTINENE